MGQIEEHTGSQEPVRRGGDLQERAGGSAVARRGASKKTDAGPGRDTADSTWSGSITVFTDLGLADPGLDQAVVAYAAEIDPGVRRSRSSGRTYRIAIAWAATQREIRVHRMEQELTARPRGGFRPTGSWVEAGTLTRRARKPATQRVGDVPVDAQQQDAAEKHPDPARTQSPEGGAAEQEQTKLPGLAKLATRRLQFLPSPVRASVLRRASQPDHYYGQAWRHGSDAPGSVPQFVVQILRMNDREAVVVSASRIGDDPHWHSAQYTYDLRTQAPDRGPALGRGGRPVPGVGSGEDPAGRLGR